MLCSQEEDDMGEEESVLVCSSLPAGVDATGFWSSCSSALLPSFCVGTRWSWGGRGAKEMVAAASSAAAAAVCVAVFAVAALTFDA